ncbi:MAG: glycosyltransferase family 39 protein [Bryobacteraceae bacterium]
MRFGWRHTAMRAFVALGLAVVLITEGLGSLGELRRVPLIVAWCIVLAAGIGFAAHCYRQRATPQLALPAISLLDGIAVVGVIAIVAIVGLIAFVSPPNSSDAMAYHMPRVIYWAQQHSVAFFPTPYLNQIMLQPLAEYFMLHTYLLSGSDRFVNFVQWLGMLGSVVCVSSIAGLFGARARGQVIAALFCATLPNGILQASGAKNDYLLALWLASMAYFALLYVQERKPVDLAYCGIALGLALCTKATAHLYFPGILAAIVLPALRQLRWVGLARMALVLAAGVMLVNGPQYVRNVDLSRSPLGFDSAQGDGFFRWRNETFGWKQTASNLLRNASDQLGARSDRWNEDVYASVLLIHGWMHADLNDPATTWRWTQYQPPRNTNHETNANNRWHLLILCIVAIVLAVRRGPASRIVYVAGLIFGFVLFCFYLKWQPFSSRLLLPLFVLTAPVAGAELEKLRPAALQWLLCLFLLNNARPYLFENWVRPLRGPNSILRTSRDDDYFSDFGQWRNRASYLTVVEAASKASCDRVGIDINEFQLEYPFQALLREATPSVEFMHTGVRNASLKYARPSQPCAVLCMNCAGKPARLGLYGDFGTVVQAGEFVLILR